MFNPYKRNYEDQFMAQSEQPGLKTSRYFSPQKKEDKVSGTQPRFFSPPRAEKLSQPYPAPPPQKQCKQSYAEPRRQELQVYSWEEERRKQLHGQVHQMHGHQVHDQGRDQGHGH